MLDFLALEMVLIRLKIKDIRLLAPFQGLNGQRLKGHEARVSDVASGRVSIT
jgi:hypothetical protein